MAATCYRGVIAPDQDNGGSCTLELADGRFVLQLVRFAPYSIEDGQRLSGTYAVNGEAFSFASEEFYSYSWETEKVERVEKRTMRFQGRLGEAKAPGAARPVVINLRLRKVWALELTLWPA